MALTIRISNLEISANPRTGLVTGNADPGVNRTGVFPLLVDSDDQNLATLDANKTIFDGHNHVATNPTGAGGVPIGSGPTPGSAVGGKRAIAVDGINTAAMADLSVNAAVTQNGAIGTEEIADNTFGKDQVGAPNVAGPVGIPSGGTHTFSHGLGYEPMASLEYNPGLGLYRLLMTVTTSSFVVHNPGLASTNATVRYYGG